MITRNRFEKILTLAAVAMAFLSASVNAAGTVVYQDNYDNDGIGTNAGIGGGAVSINTSPVSMPDVVGGWIDDGNLTMTGSTGWGGCSGGSYSSNAFSMPGGFILEVTYNALNSQDRFTMGLMEELGAEDRLAYAALATSGSTAYEGIYFNGFAYDSRGRYPNAPGLQLADGSAVIQLSDAQSRDTGVHTLVLEMDAASNWSYSIDGAPATTGTIGGDGFDLSKSYRFITRNQPRRASQIYAVTLTSAGSTDANLPDVDAGADMITWSGQAVLLDPNVVNNDTAEPQGTLTYLWTADAASVGDPNLDVAITDADQEVASVTITKTAPTGDATVVTMTLAVSLEGKDPVTDTMTIDVYDDACVAAKAAGLAVIDPTDFDGNCITSFEDFAVMATTWFDDYTLTKPVAK